MKTLKVKYFCCNYFIFTFSLTGCQNNQEKAKPKLTKLQLLTH